MGTPEETEVGPEQGPERKKVGRPFPKGVSGNPGGQYKQSRETDPLEDMRHIYEGRTPRTAAQQKLKKMWDDDPERFLASMKGWEQARRVAEKAGVKDEGPDEGAERAKAALEAILKKYEGK